MIGENKPSIKKIKKNILPPFSDERWEKKNSAVKDVVRSGSAISFKSSDQYTAMRIFLPLSYAGKTVSFSTRETRGSIARTQLSWIAGGTANNSNFFDGAGKKENVKIPSNATSIVFYLQSGGGATSEEYYYFKDVQLEEGAVATEFEEIQYEVRDSKDGIVFGGDSYIDLGDLASFKNQNFAINFEVESLDATHWHKIFCKESNIYIEKSAYEKKLHFRLDTTEGSNRYLSSVSDVFDGRRHDVTVMVKDGYSYIYIDGKLDNIRVIGGQITYNSQPCLIGTNNSRSSYLNANLGYIRLYNRALSEEEIVKVFKGSAPRSGLIAEYDFRNQNVNSNTVKDTAGENDVVIYGNFRYIRKPIEKTYYKNLMSKTQMLINGAMAYPYGLNRISVEIEEGFGRLGNKCIKITGLEQSGYAGTDRYLELKGSILLGSYWCYPVKPNTKYTYSFYGKTGSTGKIWARAIPITSTGGVLSETGSQSVIYANTDWTRIVNTFTTPSNATGVLLRVQCPDANGVGWVDSVQLEEGEVTEFDTGGNKLPKSKKSAVVKYPFSFKRESVEILENNMSYGLNQPRVTRDGIVIEESTTNLLANTAIGHGSSLMRTKELHKGRPVYHNTVTTPNVGNNFGMSKGHSSISVALGTSKTFTLSYYYKLMKFNAVNNRTMSGYIRVSYEDNTQEDFSYSHLISSNPDGNWKKIEYTFTTSTTKNVKSISNAYIYCDFVLDGEMYITDWQLEEKRFSTSYTSSSRPFEKLTAHNGALDRVAGSVEFTYIPSADWTAQRTYLSSSQAKPLAFIGTTEMGTGEPFRMWAWSGNINHFGIDVGASDGTRQNIDVSINPITEFKKGIPISFKMTWNESSIGLYIDGVLRGSRSGLKPFKDLSQYTLGIGNPQGESSYRAFSGVYKNFTVKDRNGLITFQF